MKLRTVLFAFLFALAIPASHAQPSAPGTPSAPETPPDVKAYQAANGIADPAQKIAALEKFQKDFPNSESVTNANRSILSTLASKMPEQTARMQQVAKTILGRAKDKKDKGSLSAGIAETLLTNKVLLTDAEKYARTSIGSLNEAQFIADQKAQFAKRPISAGETVQPPPTEQELIKRFHESRASRLATLGRIEFELGKMPAAVKLLNEAYAADRSQPGAQGTLGEIAAQKGDYAKALDYLIAARLAGQTAPSTLAALDSAYSHTHAGTTAGLDELLDAEYRKRFPNPLHLAAFQPTEKRTGRLVLAEVFTGSGCPPCVGADLAFDAARERYSPKDLVVVMYHQHVPRPDPMTNADTQARFKYYGVLGVPTYFIDGGSVKFNGAGRDATKTVYEHIQPPIEKDLDSPAEAKIAVTASASGSTVKVTAAVEGVESHSPDLKIHVLLLEKELRYSGENGIRFHPMVVRAMGGEHDDGFPLDPAAPASAEQIWDLDKIGASLKTQLDDYEAKGHRGSAFKFIEKKYQIDRGNLAVAVFVQDSKTKHVLQAAFVDLNPPTPHVSTGNSGEPK
jgi:thiol-disulfide isomerase/thioredoxin